jgi:hypothetical protein
VGTAQLRKRQSQCPAGVGTKSIDNFATNHCRNAQRAGQKFFRFDQIQFALPPDRNAIILARKVGIGPVGVRP